MKSDSVQLRAAMQDLVRAFGLLARDRTPFGQRISIPEAHALLILLDPPQKEALTLRDMARILVLDKSNISRLCERLKRSGLIETSTCKTDRRAKRLALTKKGRALAHELDAASLQRFNELVDELQGASSATVIESLRMLSDAIRRSDKERVGE